MMQQYADMYLLQNHSTCFECPSHPSSGVHKTVIAASGTKIINRRIFVELLGIREESVIPYI
jgi:hypothetical protein